jgi:4-amino-4-deoxy-L-arabinose transferase-like glycosyltransferase
MKSRHQWTIAALVVLGFAIRLALAFVLGINKAPESGSDQKEYDTYAWNVAQGRGYRGMSPDVADQDHLTAYRPPIPSLVWAGLYAAFGHRYDVVRIANCLAGAAAVWLTYAIGWRCFKETTGVLAAAAYAVYPTALFFSTDLLSEPLGTMWFLGLLLACLRFAERTMWERAATAGILLGISILTRPNLIFMVPLTGIWALWQFRRERATLVRGLAIPVLAVATMGPWIVRNYVVFHRFIPLSTMGGSGLLQGNNRVVVTDPSLFGYSQWDSKIPECHEALVTAGDEFERDWRAREMAIRWLKANPDKWAFLAYAKTVRAWTPFLQPKTPRLYRLGTLISWGPVLVLFLLGVVPTLVAFLQRGDAGWILHLALLNHIIITLMFWGELRYRHSIEPVCILIAAESSVVISSWIKVRSTASATELAAFEVQ